MSETAVTNGEVLRERIEQALSAAGVTGAFFVKNPQRIYIEVDPTYLVAASRVIFDMPGVRFSIASGQQTRTGFEVLYHYGFDLDDCVVSVRVATTEDPPVFDSISGVVHCAQYIEREMHDLLGIAFRDHPGLDRILLSEDWPDDVYPLRRGKPWVGKVEKRI